MFPSINAIILEVDRLAEAMSSRERQVCHSLAKISGSLGIIFARI